MPDAETAPPPVRATARRRLSPLAAAGWACVVAVAAAEVARVAAVPFVFPLAYEGDATQHVWWAARFADPDLFPDDLAYRYFSDPATVPPAHRLVYRLLVPVARDPLLLSNLIPLALVPLSVALAYLAGRRAAGDADAPESRRVVGGLAGLAFLVGWGFFGYAGGGMARGWAVPVVLGGAWALVAGAQAWLGVALLAGSVLYPPAAVSLGAATAVTMAGRVARDRRLPARWPALLVLGGLALAVLAWLASRGLPADLGPRVSAEAARAMPEFGPGGRQAFFVPKWREFWFTRGRSGVGMRPETLAWLAGAVALLAALRRRSVPGPAWALLGTSLGLFALAHAVLFALYLPNRYVTYALPVGVMLAVAGVAPRLLEDAAGRLDGVAGGRTARLAPAVGIAAFAAFALWQGVAASQRRAGPAPRDWHQFAVPGVEGAWAYLRSLPKDVSVAGHPRDAERVPLHARRTALVGADTALAYHVGYYRLQAERLRAALAATYATTWGPLDALHEAYGTDVFLVNRRRLTDPASMRFPAPFGKQVKKLRRAAEASGRPFVLLDPPADRVLYRSGAVTLVRLGPDRPELHPAGR